MNWSLCLLSAAVLACAPVRAHICSGCTMCSCMCNCHCRPEQGAPEAEVALQLQVMQLQIHSRRRCTAPQALQQA